MLKTIHNLDVQNKRVIVRCDFNVPISESGEIRDDYRIKAVLPTIRYLKENGSKIILISHLGRPEKNQKSKINPSASLRVDGEQIRTIKNQKYSLKPIAFRLEKLLNEKVKFLNDCVGEEIEKETKAMRGGEIILLENLRFHKEEKENDENFAKGLSRMGDAFINEGFSVCHRYHASVVGITKYLPSAAGFLLEKEITVLSQIIENPKRPLVVIIGGAKIEDKAKVTERFAEIADFLIVGNLIAAEIKRNGIKFKNPERIVLPFEDEKYFDMSEETVDLFCEKISSAKTIFWAGPLGRIEDTEYRKGSINIANAIIESGAFSIVGGGDTIEFLSNNGLIEKFSYVSIGGGAMLDFLAGKRLPGIEILR